MAVTASKKTFKVLRSKFLGVVFNDVKPQLFHTYYDYGYYHYGRAQYPYYSITRERATEIEAKLSAFGKKLKTSSGNSSRNFSHPIYCGG